nr:B3 domain-containing protein REM5-like isoform X2 [Ipomoea batatas]GMD88434.1 B3 domain-containing protein REM5-like isoform X2 [Ipomoea batatas]GME17318.1 B3 domain-containing protein REM5-like isoform X2 [Ipomoea batatas]
MENLLLYKRAVVCLVFRPGENSSILDQDMKVKKESDTEDDKSPMLIGPSKTTTNSSFVTILSASIDDKMVCAS